MNYLDNDYIMKIIKKKNVFSFFREAYLFGSILWSNSPNDVDILLIYDIFSDQIFIEEQKIRLTLGELLPACPIDFTTLSTKEMAETQFLNKISQTGCLPVFP